MVEYHGMFVLSSYFDINASEGVNYWLGSEKFSQVTYISEKH